MPSLYVAQIWLILGYVCARRIYYKACLVVTNSGRDAKDSLLLRWPCDGRRRSLKERRHSESRYICGELSGNNSGSGLCNGGGSLTENLSGLTRQPVRPNDYETANSLTALSADTSKISSINKCEQQFRKLVTTCIRSTLHVDLFSCLFYMPCRKNQWAVLLI